MASQRKKQARFAVGDDIKLLKEVVAVNPFKHKGKWQEIGDKISTSKFQIDGRRARERTQLMMSQYKKETNENLKK